MMAPLTPLAPPAADPDLPPVRFDVRVGSGRAANHEMTGPEFLIGGTDGCELRLVGAGLPPVICHFTRTKTGLKLRRLAPAFPILLNGAPLAGSLPVDVAAGDRVSVGSADLVVNLHGKGHLRPKFFPVEPDAAAPPKPVAVDTGRERAELQAWQAKLEEQSRELEADRVAWYRRRQELEVELERMGETVRGAGPGDRDRQLARREAEVADREAEMVRVRQELTDIRTTLFRQYEDRRTELARLSESVRGATDAEQARHRATEADLDRRRRELDDEAGRRQEYVDAEVARRADELEADLRRRKIELEIQHELRLRQMATDAADRRSTFETELAGYEPRLADLHAQRAAATAGFRDLDTQQQALNRLRDDLARERQAVDAERRFLDEQRDERERLFAVREAELVRQEDLAAEDRASLATEREQHAGDLVRVERWQAAVEDRQLELDRRAAEIDHRTEQLARDAGELEEHLHLAEAEQQRVAGEADRLDRVKADLDGRAAQLTDRAAQVEAQQAALAVLRVRLDRQQEELHREAARLTADRARLDAAQRHLDERLSDTSAAVSADAQRHLDERSRTVEAAVLDLRRQQEALLADTDALRQRERALDARSTDLAEQTATLKVKLAQVGDLQARLEADRSTVRERESTLTDADTARATFQEQLRKRAEELAARGRQLDDLAVKLADDRLALDRQRSDLKQRIHDTDLRLTADAQRLADRDGDLARSAAALADRETALERQVARLRDTGKSVADGRKSLADARLQWATEQAALAEQTRLAREELDAARRRAVADADDLRQQAPDLEDRAAAALDRLTAARELVRGQLAELHSYATQSRDTLDGLRTDLRTEAERLRDREHRLEAARGEHRLAVAEFRQQLLDWQSKVGELKTLMAQSEHRIDTKQADLIAASRRSDETALELARRMEQLRIDQDDVSERRVQVERHLADMREWYRKKLRDLADRGGSPGLAPPAPTEQTERPDVLPMTADLDPGDKHLGELLQSLELVDAETVNQLWGEAQRQRRTLRQVLLASGAITLYQLALIEAGNLDALMLGRFRVVDRVRVTPREAVYRVSDPTRAGTGLCALRVLGDAEMHDATHPDEYRMRFAAALAAPHPHLVATLEVLDVNGRPAVVQEHVAGLPGSEWPAAAAVPGVWLALLTAAAEGIDAAHQAGLVHGRITADTFVLAADGSLKMTGFGDPPWLANGFAASFDPTPELDLRALGQVAFGWSVPAAPGKKKTGRAAKGLPEPLLAVLRRLEADPPNAMGDTVSGAEPYRSAGELVAELHKLAAKHPAPPDAWADLTRFVSDHAGDTGVRKAG